MDDPAASVTVCEDGPLLLRGQFTLLTQDGEEVDPGRRTVALCRCGRSAIKPFCDGTHKMVGFQAPSAPTGERPLSGASASPPAPRSDD
ncbi:CDGSH iron-sulfur domain-containing protein [Dactylosporangium aurantiacum]|uniref:CDGSH iron-sulfur domain-containing protein n=1 Tax=Dactylosporangium aurantiacum TaxID=35754 RepID=A0A9Q9I851_9ACTN|nr:CDGSH iron-sulfur domain-containing protein [Dactylosporangium aurantiacum]MDG6106769.1 CDGSH iron-sulfur domain-containing protein [Dactylosporangium aurantiacum]UWZ50911.1 CDGSH iron-sulfur domain-containing protein [Dactylosporangium aurantiacum]